MLLAHAITGYAGPLVAPATRIQPVAMRPPDEGRYMYGVPFAPEGMGREFINADGVRRPLADFVGASEEMQLGAYFKGEKLKPWDPLELNKLSKVSANNPDVAFLREAELKHGRIAMLAFVGIIFTSGDVHWGAPAFEEAAAGGWPNALDAISKSNPGIFAQAIATIAWIEGVSNASRGKGADVNWWDGLWFGEREPSAGSRAIVAGDIGFDPLRLMPTDPAAADQMRLKELKNGRLAMLAVMGIFMQYVNTGIDPFA